MHAKYHVGSVGDIGSIRGALGDCPPVPALGGVHCLPAEGALGKRYAGVRNQVSEQMDTQE